MIWVVQVAIHEVLNFANYLVKLLTRGVPKFRCLAPRSVTLWKFDFPLGLSFDFTSDEGLVGESLVVHAVFKQFVEVELIVHQEFYA